ncbi:TIGR02221 family CRISPR-associated protein [Herpetosiphon geysericola]|uniref:CRISPR-associated protein n=1 Tax=Herpetosiphon geysericola TaxID=70996 RepID=A0A0P6XBR2_9CHLR|nr:TIGR02221 family CRISPR-associated protein [Herpetosiphon geysericola]KPL80191.1 hypothetical protein SE18_24330 [Herpetosiphon geysericola]
MTKKAIAFLGKGRYSFTQYCYTDSKTGNVIKADWNKYFSATLTFFYPDIEELYIVMTEEARKEHWDNSENPKNLKETLKLQKVRVIPVPIDSGRNDTELWEIFKSIVKVIDYNDEIIFDITNAFRSQPVITMIIASFIKVIKNAKITHLVYGAWDARVEEKDSENNIKFSESPVFDLSAFLTLLDWTTATNTFIQTGRAEQLTKLAETFKNDAVEGFAKQVHKLSQELLTTRPVGVMQAASGFEQALAKVEAAVQQNPAMQPYQQLLERIKDEYSPFAIATEPMADLSEAYATARQQQRAFLAVQLEMIKWYLEKGLPIQAMTLAREWLILLSVYYQNADGEKVDMFIYNEKKVIESFINGYSPQQNNNRSQRNDNKKPKMVMSAKLQKSIEKIQAVWDSEDASIRTIRNDIAHCGLDIGNSRTATEIAEQAETICQRLYALLPTE